MSEYYSSYNPFISPPNDAIPQWILLGTGPASHRWESAQEVPYGDGVYHPGYIPHPGMVSMDVGSSSQQQLPTQNYNDGGLVHGEGVSLATRGEGDWNYPFTSGIPPDARGFIQQPSGPVEPVSHHDYGNMSYPSAPVSSSNLVPSLSVSQAGPSNVPESSQPIEQSRSGSRKQNVACDTCRTKKIKCIRSNGADKCDQCTTRNLDCTSHYIATLSSRPRRLRKNRAGSSEGVEEGQGQIQPSTETVYPKPTSKRQRPTAGDRRNQDPVTRMISDNTDYRPFADDDYGSGGAQRGSDKGKSRHAEQGPLHLLADLAPSTISQTDVSRTQAPTSKQAELISYLFSAYPVVDPGSRYTDLSSIELSTARCSDIYEDGFGEVWSEAPTRSQRNLDSRMIDELIADLVESYFTVVNRRIPILSQTSFQSRLASPDLYQPVPHGLIAVVLALGARFSDHQLFQDERTDSQSKSKGMDGGANGRSRIIQLMVIRAREVVEVTKVGRVGTLENVHTLLLLELLLGQSPYLGRKYRGQYSSQAAALLHAVGCETPHSIQANCAGHDKEAWSMIWRFAYLCDSTRAGLFGLQCQLPEVDADFSLHLQSFNLFQTGSTNRPWMTAAVALCSLYRSISLLSTSSPRGISARGLNDLVQAQTLWERAHLKEFGVPRDIPAAWDYLEVVHATMADAFHHCIWLLLDKKVRELGFADAGSVDEELASGWKSDGASLRVKVGKEALMAALRISHLVTVLSGHDYLALDPLILHQPIIEAGLHLAQLGRQEYQSCIKGLQQASHAYPQLLLSANSIEQTFRNVSSESGTVTSSSRFSISRSKGPTSLRSQPPSKSAGQVYGWQRGTYSFDGVMQDPEDVHGVNVKGLGGGPERGSMGSGKDENGKQDPRTADLNLIVGLPMFA